MKVLISVESSQSQTSGETEDWDYSIINKHKQNLHYGRNSKFWNWIIKFSILVLTFCCLFYSFMTNSESVPVYKWWWCESEGEHNETSISWWWMIYSNTSHLQFSMIDIFNQQLNFGISKVFLNDTTKCENRFFFL
jgi:hypothetical protein